MNVFFRLFIFIAFLFFTNVVYSTEVDVRIAGFLPDSKLFREIYGSLVPVYQVEASCPLNSQVQAWTNLSYLNIKGGSVPLHLKARLQMLPLSGGVKFLFPLSKCFEIYTGVGICYTWLKENMQVPTFPTSNQTGGVGGIFKLGLTKKFLCSHFSLFIDYQHQEFRVKNEVSNQKVNASGFFFGGSAGIFF